MCLHQLCLMPEWLHVPSRSIRVLFVNRFYANNFRCLIHFVFYLFVFGHGKQNCVNGCEYSWLQSFYIFSYQNRNIFFHIQCVNGFAIYLYVAVCSRIVSTLTTPHFFRISLFHRRGRVEYFYLQFSVVRK